MRNKGITFLFLQALTLLILSCTSPPTEKKQTTRQRFASFVEVDSCNYDFGDIRNNGEPVEHLFKLKNEGNETLFISDVIGGCDCIATSFTKSPFSPSETATVRIRFSPLNKKGIFNKSVLVLLNDGEYYIQVFIQGVIST